MHPRAGSAASAGLATAQLDSAQPLALLRGGVGEPGTPRAIDLPMPERRGGRCDISDHTRGGITDAQARGKTRRGVGRPARARMLRSSSISGRCESRSGGRQLRRPSRRRSPRAFEPRGSRDPLPLRGCRERARGGRRPRHARRGRCSRWAALAVAEAGWNERKEVVERLSDFSRFQNIYLLEQEKNVMKRSALSVALVSLGLTVLGGLGRRRRWKSPPLTSCRATPPACLMRPGT